MSDEKRTVSVSGAGSIAGGSYSSVSISGAGRVNGNLYAEELRMSGAGRVNGECEVVHLTVSGTGKFVTSRRQCRSSKGSSPHERMTSSARRLSSHCVLGPILVMGSVPRKNV